MNQRLGNGSFDALEDADNKVLARSPSALDNLTHGQRIASEQLGQQIFIG
jgi:hypothetical protein